MPERMKVDIRKLRIFELMRKGFAIVSFIKDITPCGHNAFNGFSFVGEYKITYLWLIVQDLCKLRDNRDGMVFAALLGFILNFYGNSATDKVDVFPS